MFRKTMLVAAALQAVSCDGLAEQASPPAPAASVAEPPAVQRVEITGSSIRRIDAETALPITTISRADIERTGATTAQDLVNLIPANFGGSVVANNVGATGVPSTANLRSLGPKYTLVLLNGRRVANYAFGNSPVDLNTIPLSAVERIEVLRDGASAIYGADAIAGVINFILKKDHQGLEASIYATHAQQGGGDTRAVNITGGFGDLGEDRVNVLLSANLQRDDVLKAKDRAFAASSVVPELGINKASPRNGVPNLSFVDLSGNAYGTAGDASQRFAPLINPYRYNGCNLPEFSLVVRDASTCGTDYVQYIDLIPQQRHANLVARASFAVADNHTVFAEAIYTRDEIVSTYSPAPYTLNMAYPQTGRFYPSSIIVPAGVTLKKGYTLPDGTVLTQDTVLDRDIEVTPTGPITGTWRTVAGGGRSDVTQTTGSRFLIGANGVLGDWDYELGLAISRNKGVVRFGPGQYSYAKLTPLMEAGEINVFGPQDEASMAALESARLRGEQGHATSTSSELDARFSRALFTLPGGDVAFALGASLRKEKLDQVSEPVLATGDQVGGAGPVPSVVGDRRVLGLFTEFVVPLTKELELGLAARYDKYDNSFGTSFSAVSPKASLRWSPSKDFLLRASMGRGYRAPTLYENLRPFTSGNNTAANWSDPIRCPGGVPISPDVDSSSECDVQLNAATSGDMSLEPEKSKQWALGMAWSPTATLNFSADYWRVDIDDAIIGKSEIQVMSEPDKFKDFIFRYDPVNDPAADAPIAGSQNPAFPIAYVYLPYDNAGQFYASGLDFSAQYRERWSGIGRLGVALDFTYFFTHGYRYTGGAKVSDLGVFKDYGAAPRLRSTLTFSWQGEGVGASLSHNLTQGYIDYVNPAAINGADYPAERRVSAYCTWDAQLRWSAFSGFDLSVGVKNLLDTDPPRSRNELYFQVGYDPTFTNPIGRQYYVRAQYRFF